ncbi:MAG: nucleoside hydrolase [Pseudomonadota bacterium]
MSAIPLILDTDPGIDDAIAIMAAIAAPQIDLKALTTVFGNVPVATAMRNAQFLAASAGAAVPVAKGAAAPLVQAPPPHPAFVHGVGGLGALSVPDQGPPDPRSAADLMAEVAAAEAGRLVILAVGPLTNLAIALDRHPQITAQVARVVVMGGALRHPGNVRPYAEANFWQDPDAAAAVLAADWPVTMVGLDVTETVRLYPDDVDTLPARAPVCGKILREAFAHYAGFHVETRGFDGCFLHDPASLVAVTDPGCFETWRVRVRVETGTETPGAVVEDPAGAPVDVCISADGPGIRRRLMAMLGSGALR